MSPIPYADGYDGFGLCDEPVPGVAAGVEDGEAYQPDRASLVWKQAVRQWWLLTKVWDHFERKRDRRLGLAILGAELVRNGELCPLANKYADLEVEVTFETYSEITSEELFGLLSPVWSPRLRRFGRWAYSIGPRILVSVSSAGIERLRPPAA